VDLESINSINGSLFPQPRNVCDFFTNVIFLSEYSSALMSLLKTNHFQKEFIYFCLFFFYKLKISQIMFDSGTRKGKLNFVDLGTCKDNKE